MQLFELERIVEETNADHWNVISGGPTFLHSYMVTGGFDESSHISAVEYHEAIAVLRGDVDVRLAWGYDPDFGERERQFFPKQIFPDPAVTVELGDMFYRGALVQRYWLISVDGHRATLPMPKNMRRAGAEPMSQDSDDYEQVVTQREVNFARLIDDLRGHRSFDEYLQRSGFVVT